jgi:hypothetical protein
MSHVRCCKYRDNYNERFRTTYFHPQSQDTTLRNGADNQPEPLRVMRTSDQATIATHTETTLIIKHTSLDKTITVI